LAFCELEACFLSFYCKGTQKNETNKEVWQKKVTKKTFTPLLIKKPS
jgi:hypothetical protein